MSDSGSADATELNSSRAARAAKRAETEKENTLEQRMDARFAKLERAMEAMAAAVSAPPRKKNKKRKDKAEESDTQPPKKKSRKAKKAKSQTSFEPSSSHDDQDLQEIIEAQHVAHASSKEMPPLTATHAIPDVTTSHSSLASNTLRPQQHSTPTPSPPTTQVTTQVNIPAPMSVADVNKPTNDQNEHWSQWILRAGSLEPTITRPTTIGELNLNDHLQARVTSILQETVTHMSKGNKIKNFPYEYVLRGHEKRHTSMNSLTLPEHIWGIFAMIKDSNTSNKIKPALLRHIDEIVEDCRDYDWPTAVRRWSEEVFSLVAEGRLPNGWLETGRIQLLRISLSNVSTAKLSNNKELNPRGKGANHNSQYASETWRGAPPCTDYNSPTGCSFASGHILNGRKMQHVCANCFENTGATFHHSVVNCRNKNRDKQHHHF